MTWSRKLPKPLYLNDGRTLATLAQARDAVLALPQLHQIDPRWRHAFELLMEASYRSRQDAILDVETQLSCVLETVGLI
jgi:hypothetical protein